ncbi:MAG: NAD(+) synthase [Candidatus Magasanikbacteria bacterium RIFOXYB2_FULL_40_13]|uniref:NH(3)-dependent NAD(+) synthetase n=2 Tax=Candidatus Magasanikiibacteriota TaxID=1752731 RepID=A0A1F6NTY6_9BACT|nr:MAG: NAD(+) synthase [Candidatus Magasanikbacteria bacterium RIFOXYB2_FULL_40_13]OGH87094.1 MAG: NAD(+) synthase [Candidatus Magasanikbacteria bacterium RIFOXYA1_FULL_40_8]
MFGKKKEKRIKLPTMNCYLVADQIGRFITDTVLSAHKTGGVIGLSGGVDSTVVAALAQMAFNIHNRLELGPKLELVGYILPSKTNQPEDTLDGLKVARRLGIRHEIYNIEPHISPYDNILSRADKKSYLFHKGNAISRARGNILSTFAALENKIVLGTGNKDEDFGIGYYTLFGDGAVHCSPIGDLSKRLVRQMAVFLNFSESANRIPTAGLEPGQTDFKDVGYSYDVVELLTEAYTQGLTNEEVTKHSLIVDLIEKEMLGYVKTFGVPKFLMVKDIIGDFLRRNKSAQAKAKILHPPIAKVTLEYK